MNGSLQRPIRLATTLAMLALVALGISPAALAGYWGGPDRFDAASLEADRTGAAASYSGGPDRFDAASLEATGVAPLIAGYAGGPERTRGTLTDYELDPAIRFAIAARATETPVGTPVSQPARAPNLASDDGFAWGAAALGLGLGALAMCLVLGCVTLVRHDGRLRNA